MKKKLYIKLIAVTAMFLVAMTAVVSASYAWFQLSSNPIADGIQVSISGGSTILIAADMTQTVDGVTYHYPGNFSESLNFSQHDSYAYLQDLGGLRPVSTADGIYWFVADKYDAEDEKVKNGEALIGQPCEIEDMIRDLDLSYANLSAEEEDKLAKGHYIYMDYWVVSPGSDYYLRVSTSDEGGSFVLDLLSAEETDTNATGYTLTGSISSTAASVRIGFLATPDQVTDNTMLYYQQSPYFDEEYTSLRGTYQEPGGSRVYSDNYQFTIYEPNADAHPGGVAEPGAYVETFPVGMVNGTPRWVSVLNKTTVQKTTNWVQTDQGTPLIEQIFQTALVGGHISGSDATEFYRNYLQCQFAPYVQSGDFIRNTMHLYGTMDAAAFGALETAGATDDVYIIQLQKNVPQRIRMYIWLEGQDVDWNPKDAASSFVLNLELAGGTE